MIHVLYEVGTWSSVLSREVSLNLGVFFMRVSAVLPYLVYSPAGL